MNRQLLAIIVAKEKKIGFDNVENGKPNVFAFFHLHYFLSILFFTGKLQFVAIKN